MAPTSRAAALWVAALLLAVFSFSTQAAASLTVDAPPALQATAERIRGVDLQQLGDALTRAGLALPPAIHITLVADADPQAKTVPGWIVGLAAGDRHIVIFPDRVVSYPYDSLESVVRHEITHLALNARAGGQPLPRWFHEGVATSVDAGFDLGAQVRLAAAMIGEPGPARLGRLFAAGGESEAREAYLLATVLVEDLRRRHGATVPGAIAARLSATTSFEQAFIAETAHTPDAAAAQAWASYRRWTSWIPAVTSASATWALILILAFAAYAAQVRRRWRRRREWDDDEPMSVD